MADDMEYALSCSICMELFNEPMLLPCAHSLCKACLDKLRKPQGKAASKTIDCPQCREKLDIGLNCENVKKNFQLASIIDIYRLDSSRRQQLDVERPQHQHEQPPQIQQAQRMHQLQQTPQGAKPKLGFLAQLRQKQTQRQKKSKSCPPHTNPINSSEATANTGPLTYIQNVRASLRKTPDHTQDSQSDAKPVPRRSAPLPPIPKPRVCRTLEEEQLGETPPPLPPSRRSVGSLPSRVPPPVFGSLPSRVPPPVPKRPSQVRGSSPSGSNESQSTQESEDTQEPSTEAQSPSSPDERPTNDHSPNIPISNTLERSSNAPDAVSDQPNQTGPSVPDASPNSQEPNNLLNMSDVTLPEAHDHTEQVECSGVNDLGPECCTCERVPASQAIVQCQTCAMLFCSTCLGAFHPEPDSHHEVKPIKEIKADEKCVLCEKEKWSMFCMECNMLFCQGCQLGHHPTELKHWTHVALVQRSLSVTDINVPHSQLALQRRTVSVPAGMATQGLEEATGCSPDETRCSSCSNAAFARCLDCGENLCELCARVKHQSEDLENHTVVKLSESKLKVEDVEKLVQLGLLELMLLKQALMDELSSKVQKD